MATNWLWLSLSSSLRRLSISQRTIISTVITRIGGDFGSFLGAQQGTNFFNSSSSVAASWLVYPAPRTVKPALVGGVAFGVPQHTFQ